MNSQNNASKAIAARRLLESGLLLTFVLISIICPAQCPSASNLATSGVASSSSVGSGGVASRVNDGSTDGIYANGSVAHTGSVSASEWIQIDLGSVQAIGDIVVWNRADVSVMNRLSNAYILAADTPFPTDPNDLSGALANADFSFQFGNTTNVIHGVLSVDDRIRYIRVQKSGSNLGGNSLQIAEIQATSTCDSDQDNVVDLLDIDDDNDGIIDQDEGEVNTTFHQYFNNGNLGTIGTYTANPGSGSMSNTGTISVLGTTSQYYGIGNGGATNPLLTLAFDDNVTNVQLMALDFDSDEEFFIRVYDGFGTLIEDITPFLTYVGEDVGVLADGGIGQSLSVGPTGIGINYPNDRVQNAFRLDLSFEVSLIEIEKINSGTAGSQFGVTGAFEHGDADGDGISNQFDLDSDNDGCADYIESAGSFTNADGILALGVVDGNGGAVSTNLGNAVNNSGIPLIAGNGFLNGHSITPESSPDCTDCDSDGIANYLDTDDDNDGILDAEEGYIENLDVIAHGFNFGNYSVQLQPPFINSVSNIVEGSGINTSIVVSFLSVNGVNSSSHNQAVSQGDYLEYTFTTGANLLGYYVDAFEMSPRNTGPYQMSVYISDDNFISEVQLVKSAPVTVTNSYLNYDFSDFKLLPSTVYTVRIYFFGLNSFLFDDPRMLIGEYGGQDTDADGDLDQCDLDSDNDLCPDVLEANYTDSDGDEVLGNSPVTVNNTGQIIGQGGYTGTNAAVTTFNISGSASNEACSILLPIELLSYTAEKFNEEALLKWITQSELNNNYFQFERSVDLITWEKIGVVQGAGNSQDELRYEFMDKTPYPEINYYRLSQVDYDGQTEFVGIRSLDFTPDNKSVLWPNPAMDVLTVKPKEDIMGDVELRVVDVLGKVVKLEHIQGETTVNVANFESGTYYIELITEGRVENLRFIKL